MNKSISVIIPTKNGGEQFRETLDSIFSQEIDAGFEVVIVDSGSTDQTLQICKDFPVKLIQIPPSSFSHGSTRNEAISRSSGEFCVLTVQDAVPVNRQWLATLVTPLFENNMIGGVFGRQISKTDGSSFSRCCKGLWYREWRKDWPIPFEQLPVKMALWHKATPEEKRALSRFDNVNSCLRRSVWEQIPFPNVAYAEDVAWAIKVITSGFSLYWQPEAKVYHSHERSLGYELQRSYVDTKSLAVLFGGNASFLTYQMSRSVVDWLINEAAEYLQTVSTERKTKKEGIALLSEADRIWQLIREEEIRLLQKGASGKVSNNRGVKEFFLYHYYGGLAGPRWLRKVCRDFFRRGRFFSTGTPEGPSGAGPSIVLKLQGIHRSFFSQLFQVHLAYAPYTLSSKQSIRLASAVMVAGSFLGQYLGQQNISEDKCEKGKNKVVRSSSGHQDVWQILANWYGQTHVDDSAALFRLAKLLGDGV